MNSGWERPDFEGLPCSLASGQGPPLPWGPLPARFTLVSAPSAKCESIFSSLLTPEPTPQHLHPQPRERDWGPGPKQGNIVSSVEASWRG